LSPSSRSEQGSRLSKATPPGCEENAVPLLPHRLKSTDYNTLCILSSLLKTWQN
jgi:hypothetical protein